MRSLDLSGWRLGEEGLARLSRARLPRLRALDLSFTELTDQAVEALVTSTMFDRIEHLDLRGNEIGDDGLAALAASPRCACLRSLRLGSMLEVTPTPDGIAALARSPHLAALNQLDLSDYPLLVDGEEAARRLVASPHLGRLVSLKLGRDGRALEVLRTRWGTRAASPGHGTLFEQLAERP